MSAAAPPAGALRLFAVAAPGLEALVAAEVRALPGAEGVREVPGGVDFAGDVRVVWRANLTLRTATRVLLRLGEVRARDFGPLRAGAAELPWATVAARGARASVSASARKCRLYHTGAIAERIEGAVADALGPPSAAAGASAAPPLDVLVRGADDVFTISVDTSGERLHQRGWRTDVAEASLRETLAAALVELAAWRPADGEPLLDPMCGAGTIVLEAATRALGHLPGGARDFACMRWPGFDAAAFAGERTALAAAARAAAPDSPPLLLGADRDPAAIAAAQRNAARAGADVAAATSFICADAAALQLPAPPPRPGLILCNPPYGKRIPAGPALAALAALARRLPGWRLAVLHPSDGVRDRRLLTALGPRRPRARHRLDNGGLPVYLHIW